MPDSRLCVSLSSELFYVKQLVLGPSLPKFPPFILLEILNWKEPKSRALFIFQPEFHEILL